MSLSSGDNPKCGQLTASGTPAALGSQPCTAVLVQNDPNSGVNLQVGDSSHQYLGLKAGQSITIPCSNISQVYVSTLSGTATVNYLSVS